MGAAPRPGGSALSRLAIRLGLALALALSGTVAVHVLRRASQARPAAREGARPGLTAARERADPSHALGAASVETRFAPPPGFARVPVAPGSFGAFLRALPLRPEGTPVRLHTGALKARQDVHAAVVDRDPGPRNLQQCADAAIRLRAEHLYAAGRAEEISFHFTSGFPCDFATWRRGLRPHVEGSEVRWVGGAPAGDDAASLRRYLDVVFTYAGTASLPRDVEPVRDPGDAQGGDLYLQPGSPGHAMIVLDVAVRGASRAILLAQGYMPAQDIHVVRNPGAPDLCPWYVVGEGENLVTPEWTFAWTALRRFRDRTAGHAGFPEDG